MASQNGEHGESDLLCAPDRGLEDWRFGERQSNVKTDQHKPRAGEERKPPAKRVELLIRKPAREQQEDPSGKNEADRRTQLRKHTIQGALIRWRILYGEQNSAAPLSAEAYALTETAKGEQQWCGDADGGIAG